MNIRTNKPNLLVWTSKNVIHNNMSRFELGLGPIEPIGVGASFYTPLGPGPGPGLHCKLIKSRPAFILLSG